MAEKRHKNKKKNKLYNWVYSIVLLLIILGISFFRSSKEKHNLHRIEGTTMGGIEYTVAYLSPFKEPTINKQHIDSILIDFNQELSHYIPTSTLSKLNKGLKVKKKLKYMYKTLSVSKSIYKKSIYYFNPAIGPLIDFWGFGVHNKNTLNPNAVDNTTIDSLLYLCDFNKIQFSEQFVKKDCTYVKLNFSAIAKGQAVDVLFEEVRKSGFENILVNIGGECRVSGKNAKGTDWIIGISKPSRDNLDDFPVARVHLKNQSIATSGNYRSYKDLKTRIIGHTINPVTGFPAENDLISVSVVASECIEADAWATAFMAMGLEYSKRILESQENISAYFIFRKNGILGSYATPSFREIIIDELVQ